MNQKSVVTRPDLTPDSLRGVKPTITKRYFEIYAGADGQFYWRAVARANKKITFTGEGHPTVNKAVRAIVQECAALGAEGVPEIRNLVPPKPKAPKVK